MVNPGSACESGYGRSSTVTGSETPVERFKPTSGFAFGYIAIALMLVALVYVVTSVHTVTGLRVGLATVFAAVLVWATQIGRAPTRRTGRSR